MNQLCCLCKEKRVTRLGKAICTPCYIKESEKKELKIKETK